MKEFKLLTIAKQVETGDGDNYFQYRQKTYEKLMIWDNFERILDVQHKKVGFYLEDVLINDIPYLVLCYSEDKTYSFEGKKLRQYLIETFFQSEDKGGSDIDIGEASNSSSDSTSRDNYLTVDEFYEKLKQAHAEENFGDIPENVQHPMLRSSTVLRPYQIRGIRWMLKRELETDPILPDYVKMTSKYNPQHVFYYHPLTCDFRENNPYEGLTFPRGGMLCDEMGLGKSVEMITLILMNPRRQGQKRQHKEEISEETKTKLTPTKKTKVKCPCNKDAKKKLATTLVVCSRCFNAQHIKCAFQKEISDEDRYEYVCCYCWKSSEKLLDVKTTIIVSPTSIKRQWEKEIQRHVCDNNFKVLVYNGISNGYIQPKEIGSYDCVITDFNTLSRELYFAKITERKLRHEKKIEYPQSPLIQVKWWRVILDEAQMVENKNSRPSQMVKQLPAVYRWCTTGTPIEKGSIQHLYGLLYFLDAYPYSTEYVFDVLWNSYRNGKSQKLIEVFCKLMWRTCKKDVLDEIKIPPQKEMIHYIEMSDLQKCFYTQVHMQTKPEFTRHIQDYLLRNSRDSEMVYVEVNGVQFKKIQKIIDLSLMDKKLYELDNTTIKTFLEPLRKIRQDCTIANIFTNANYQTRVKQTLRSDQLHEHLVSKTSIETKSELRTICSSLNGLAALSIAQGNFAEAIALYKQVLRLAQDYTGVVSVDSMLQIHSYHNLIETQTKMTDSPDFAELENYQQEMSRLEWKYICNYYEKVQKINADIQEHKKHMNSAKNNYKDGDGLWWRSVLHYHEMQEEKFRLLEMLNTEFLHGIFGQPSEVRTLRGIDLMITNWLDKLEKCKSIVYARFKKLDFIVNDLKPAHELTAERNERINKLAQSALDCHLYLEHLDLDDDEPPPPRTTKPCQMCELKNHINEYECVLFNKEMVDDNVEGTWNPRLEERLLKAVLQFARRNLSYEAELIEMGKNFFTYLEALKTRYRHLAQLWVEVNYTISAYDELNMSKMRIEVVDSYEGVSKEDKRLGVKIARYEIAEQIEVFRTQKQDAEVQFTRLNGRLKYLDHLKENFEAPQCPICTNVPTHRYYVMICAHSICVECFMIFVKDKRHSNSLINCPVCRTPQLISNIYAVTCNNSVSFSDVKINGSYSPKIDEIVRCVIQLKQDDPEVKILIFSHWDSILSAIKTALSQNDITLRTSFASKFHKDVEEFKDYNLGVTCMLMNLNLGSKGLNLTEASHVFLVEPILNADDELQAIGRIHRIGQTKETFVHKFIMKNTIESMIFDKIIQDKERWLHKEFTIRDLENIFAIDIGNNENDIIRLD